MTNTKKNVNTVTAMPRTQSKSAWTTALDTYRERRAAHASLKSLERELATYTTPAELQDLDSMVERCVDDNEIVYGPIIERIRLRAA